MRPGAWDRTRAAVIAVLLLGLLGLAAAIAFTLSDKAVRLAGTNDAPVAQAVYTLSPGQTACQADMVYGRTSAIRFLATAPDKTTPSLSVWAGTPTGTFMRGQLRAGWRPGWLVIPTQPVPHDRRAQVCFQNSGHNARAAIIGWGQTARVEFLRGNESWASIVPAIVRHFGLAKAGWQGSWSVWLAAALVLLAAVLAGWGMIRAAPR